MQLVSSKYPLIVRFPAPHPSRAPSSDRLRQAVTLGRTAQYSSADGTCRQAARIGSLGHILLPLLTSLTRHSISPNRWFVKRESGLRKLAFHLPWALPIPFLFSSDSEFGFHTHVRDVCQFLCKFGALRCLNCRREPRDRQLPPQVPLIGMCSKPFIKDRNSIAVWKELLFYRHESGNIFALVLIPIADRTSLHHEILQHFRVLFLRLLHPESKP